MTNPALRNISAENDPTGKNTFKWRIEACFEISDVWVADGFDLTPERLQEFLEDAIQRELSHAYGHEVKVSGAKVLKAPNPLTILKQQGYKVS